MARRNVIFKAEEADVEWFNNAFPMFGAKQWFFESCLIRLKRLHDEGKIESPVDLLSMVVSEIGRQEL